MDSGRSKLEKKDIGTIIVAVIALALVSFVFIKMYTGGKKLENDAGETTVHVYSQVNDLGEIEFYTMIEHYTDSGLHASVWYRPDPTTEEETEEETDEETTIVYVTDESGERVTDENGEAVTEIQKVTEPETVVEAVTDENGEKVTDENGEAVTKTVIVTSEPESKYPDDAAELTESTESTASTATTRDVWTDNTKSKKALGYTDESGTASTIISEINKSRSSSELDTLSTDKSLTSSAKSNSVAKALGTKSTAKGKIFFFKTDSGGAEIFNSINSSTDVVTGDYSKIGVGVIKHKGQYYTTVIVA